MTATNACLVFGNQLFAPEYHTGDRWHRVIMVEDEGFCRRYTYHRQKLTFMLSAMRSHADALRRAGFDVSYYRLEDGVDWRSAIAREAAGGLRRLHHLTSRCL